jgi:nitrite reductase/ring-hydroxylating ferredoxin subunit
MASRYPFSGIPSGWYVAGKSRELKRGKILSRSYFGRELILFRTESGALHATDGHCPHMGAHLAQAKVEGEIVRCPFHGFCFDGGGRCVSTPYGTRPPDRARLRVWPVMERNDLIFVYYDAHDRKPDWEVPLRDDEGWTPIAMKKYDIRTHPQETTENSVDFGHFTSVHNFLDAGMTGEMRAEGPLLRASYYIVRSLGMIGLPQRGVRAEFDVSVWGLGFSLVELYLPQFRARLRVFVLPVPVDEERIELRLGTQTRRLPWGPFISTPMTRLLRDIVFKAVCVEVEQDIPIWENKVYVEPPALAKGDGPVAAYRSWARQFYP